MLISAVSSNLPSYFSAASTASFQEPASHVLTGTEKPAPSIPPAATALIMAPIAVGIAIKMGVSIDPFLMSVAVGASCAFLTPIGHQCNALILGPGGYRFGDYWRMGLPLEIIIVSIATPLILWCWPL